MNDEKGFGQKGGMGPTQGMKASTYMVTMPDGMVVKKNSYKVTVENALACIYQHQGKWYIAGLVSDKSEVWTDNVVVAKKVK